MKTSFKRGLALRESKGFTLIELLVVIAIIGILSSVVLASLNTARVKGRVAQAQTSLKSFSTALALCVNDNTAITTPTLTGTGGQAACVSGGTTYTWPTLPTSGSWTYTAFSQTTGSSFSFTVQAAAGGDNKTILCTDSGCTTT